MSAAPWTVQEHIIPASHPRGFRRAVRDPQTSRLKLHVKEYRPSSSPPSESAVTIIFAHGIGSTKESYEPFFADLLANPATPPIRAIWAADAANHGQSYLLNAAEIGDEHHSFDGAYDIMQMVNYFQSEMRPPLIGMGQSWGIGHILMPAAWHPRFFQGIVLIEVPGGASPRPPTRSGGSNQEKRRVSGIDAGSFVAKIRDKWPSREAARKHLLKSPYYASFEKRVFEQTVRYELRDVADGHGEVTLATPRYQQAIAFSRPDPPYHGYPEGEDYRTRSVVNVKRAGFYRAEPAKMIEAMPTVHCKSLFVWSTHGYTDEQYRERLVSIMGTGHGGGGGRSTGQVQEVYVDKGGHALPFDNPTGTSAKVADWLGGEFWVWWQDEELRRRSEPPIDPVKVPPEHLERISKL